MIEHLTELRSRLIKILLFIVGGFGLSWFACSEILALLSDPIRPYLTATEGQLIFTSPFEKFASYLKVSLFSGLMISCPFWLYQVYMFVSPGLYQKERKWSLMFVGFGSLLFASGVLFVYFMVYPLSFRFLLNFGGEELPYISLKPYLSFFIRTALAFGLVFETPLVLVTLLKTGLVKTEQLKRARPYALLATALVSALVTPPDIFSMLFMMAPLYLLFELSVLIGKSFVSRETQETGKTI